jgi:pilus assembly protein Flp/PilA
LIYHEYVCAWNGTLNSNGENVCGILRQFLKDERGDVIIEYGLIVALITIAVIGAMGLLAGNVDNMYDNIENLVVGAFR